MSKGDRLSPNEKMKLNIPGPGSYETDKSTLLNERNAIGFGRKIKPPSKDIVPGVGNYNTLDTHAIL